MSDPTNRRVAYLDWMRGRACLLMFQTHCYDSWLAAPARGTHFFGLSQLGGTLPAPLFLFLAGVSAALVTDRLRQKGALDNQIARKVIVRGAQVFGFGLLFRLQEFLLGWPGAPWTDLLRVDVLNAIGLSLIMLGLICRLAAAGVPPASVAAGADAARARNATLRLRSVLLGAAAAAGVSLLSPLLWYTHRLNWLPWYLESYIDGVHTYGVPQSRLFPLYPWSAFAYAGRAAGFLLLSPWAMRNELASVAMAGAAGVFCVTLGLWLDAGPRHLYAVYDFWHTSPNFFLVRLGVLLTIILASYAWCRWGSGQWGFSPLVALGQASLLVYWVHIEFVYGRFFDSAQACDGNRRRFGGPADYLRGHDLARGCEQTVQRRSTAPASSGRDCCQRIFLVVCLLACGLNLVLRFGRGGVIGLWRQLEDHFARPCQAHLFASDALNRLGIRF